MRRGRPIPALLLKKAEREALEAWAKSVDRPQALAQRARIILLCAAGKANREVSLELGLTLQTIGKWRQRFIEKRLDGLLDEPRPGTPKKLSEADVDRVLAITLESAPTRAAHWSTRSLAQASGLSRASVHRIWRAFSVQPHRAETFRLLRDSILERTSPEMPPIEGTK